MPITPTIHQLPDLPVKEKKALQSLLIADVNYKCHTRRKPVSAQRKIVFFLLLKGYKITDALRIAGYSKRTIDRASTHAFLKSSSSKALALHYNLDKLRGLNLDYTLDRIIKLIESDDISHRDEINALKLLASVKGQLRTIFDVNISESMRIEVVLGGPAAEPLPAGGRGELDAGGAIIPPGAGFPDADPEEIEGEFEISPE